MEGYGFDLEEEVVRGGVLERNRGHSHIALLARDLNEGDAFLLVVELFEADDLWDFTLGGDGKVDWEGVGQLDREGALNHLCLLDRWHFYRHPHLGLLVLSNVEMHLLKVLEPFGPPDREHVLIQVVELSLAAQCHHLQPVAGGGVKIREVFLLQVDRQLNLVDRAGEEGSLVEVDGAAGHLD